MISALFGFVFRIGSHFVRLGEYDTEITKDGKHIDVGIARIESHNHSTSYLKINDIGIVYLKHDVEFTGDLEFYLNAVMS